MLAARRLPTAAVASARVARTYASAATGSASAQVSSTKQGVRVATYDDLASPAAGLSVVLNAGARHESSESLGYAHYLKNFAFQASNKRTPFRIAREAELQGGLLYGDLSRESISYRARFLREDWAYFTEVLAEVVTSPKFAHYALPEVRAHVQAESAAALADPQVAMMEALHRVAFRTGLGNSLYATATSGVSADAIRHYQLANLAGLTVVGHGVEHASLVAAVERAFEGFDLAPVPTSVATKYHGGNAHLDAPAAVASGNAICALAFSASAADRPAARALRYLLGGESHVKWSHGQSPLAKVAQQHGAEVRGLNLEYSDASLVGFVTHAPAGNIRSAVHDLSAELRKVASGDVSTEALQRALATARFEAADSVDSIDARLTKIGEDVAASGKSVSVAESIAAIAEVKSSDVVNLAKRLVKSRPSLAAAGNPHDLPYADELGF
ncbi:Metalloenzyme, LuxS/M16 peptidase-like protein [Thamnocephalis sphaerospora]|uniref:Cytochrome b-c1 complex subunit 2, mitochondrial n=1 Tax=Thamnocephalis sphaerospora TaxID=78915 RepID=A0A4P9XLX3_9FUNG|nr:Metalloenzyme, LuxS/M16 peptidase-like protein [Thamnocephalis sphaerospora]|eukprot:RKP06845.1 Metalloenzyme, LuxS/M16 peptidase-like protein [Thamnocephalis sphaerospora]